MARKYHRDGFDLDRSATFHDEISTTGIFEPGTVGIESDGFLPLGRKPRARQHTRKNLLMGLHGRTRHPARTPDHG